MLRVRQGVAPAPVSWENDLEMAWTFFQSDHAKVDEFCVGRTRQSDADFVLDCGMRDNIQGARAALAVRRAVAGVGLVDSAFIRADDRYPDDLEALPLWDSMDFVDLIMRIEKDLETRIPNSIAEQLVNYNGFTVRQLAQSVYTKVLLAAEQGSE